MADEVDEKADELQTKLQERVVKFMKDGGNDGNTKNLPAIIAILRLAQDLHQPYNEEDFDRSTIVTLPTNPTAKLLNHIRLTINILQDFEAQTFRKIFNRKTGQGSSAFSRDDHRVVADRSYVTYHLEKGDAVNAELIALDKKHQRGAKRSISGEDKPAKAPKKAKGGKSRPSAAPSRAEVTVIPRSTTAVVSLCRSSRASRVFGS